MLHVGEKKRKVEEEEEEAKAEQLDPRFLHECQGSRWSLMITAEDRCTAAGGAALEGRRRNYNAASDKDGENNGEEHESLSGANVCSTSVGRLCKRPPHAAIRLNYLYIF